MASPVYIPVPTEHCDGMICSFFRHRRRGEGGGEILGVEPPAPPGSGAERLATIIKRPDKRDLTPGAEPRASPGSGAGGGTSGDHRWIARGREIRPTCRIPVRYPNEIRNSRSSSRTGKRDTWCRSSVLRRDQQPRGGLLALIGASSTGEEKERSDPGVEPPPARDQEQQQQQ